MRKYFYLSVLLLVVSLVVFALSVTSAVFAAQTVNFTNGIINSSGNVGIGTTSPGAGFRLDVNGTANATQYCISGANCITSWPSGGGGVISAGNVSAGTFGANTGNGNFSFPANVGIGSSPDITNNQLAVVNTTAGHNALSAVSNGNTGNNWGMYLVGGTNSSDWTLRAYQSGGGLLFGVRGDGSVGIGTATPNNLLSLYKASGAVGITLQSGSNYGYLVNDGTNLYLASNYGTTGNKVAISLQAPDNTMTLNSSGKVGIGTTNPSTSLEVRQGGSYPALSVWDDMRLYNELMFTDSAWNTQSYIVGANGNLTLYANGGSIIMNNDVQLNSTIYSGNWFRSNGNTGWYSQTYGGGWFMQDSSWVRTYNEKNVWTGNGLLGSNGGLTVGYGGASPPGGGAMIAGEVDIGGALRVTSYGNDNWFPYYNGYSYMRSPVFYITNTLAAENGSWALYNSGKLSVGTVDPVYKINGISYATYVPGMTGQKEETAGIAELVHANDGRWEAVVDFNADQGSDAWLFAKATDLKENMNKMVVLLTPSSGGSVGYAKDQAGMKLTITGDRGGEVSYQLIAPRFDAGQWPNLSEDTSTKGFIIND